MKPSLVTSLGVMTARVLSLWVVASVVLACGGAAEPGRTTPVTAAAAVDDGAAVTTAAQGEAESHPSGAVPPFLYRVDTPRGTSYLFGTIHTGVRFEEMSPLVVEALEQSATAVFELDLATIDATEMARHAMRSEPHDAYADLSDVEWATISALVQLPHPILVRMEPWYLATVMSLKLYPITKSLDESLYEHAKSVGKRLAFLETFGVQLEALKQTFSVEDVRFMVARLDVMRRTVGEMLSAFRTADEEALASLFVDPDMVRDPAQVDTLLLARNEKWVPKLEALFAEGKVFVAVGAGHLVGEHSVVAMLRQKGYVVERVPVGATSAREGADRGTPKPRVPSWAPREPARKPSAAKTGAALGTHPLSFADV